MPEVTLRTDAEAWRRSLLGGTEVVVATTIAHSVSAASTAEPAPTLWSVLFIAILALPATALVIHHKVSIRLALPLLILAQLVGHLVLAAPSALQPQVTHSGHAAHDPWQLSWQMLAAHLAAVVVTAAVWRLRRHALDAVIRWEITYQLPIGNPTPIFTSEQAAARRDWLRAHPLRGPPPGVACS